MKTNRVINYIGRILNEIPSDWLNLTTHRLDIYDESQAKSQFLDQLEKLFEKDIVDKTSLEKLPTAYDYIRLGHPLSSVLEWGIAKIHNLLPEQVICFSSRTMPILAVLRKNHLDNINTQLCYIDSLPATLDLEILQEVYGYKLETKKVESISEISAYEGKIIFIGDVKFRDIELSEEVDFYADIQEGLGSVIMINGEQNLDYVSAIQHVRRRETIAMTPANSLIALKKLVNSLEIEQVTLHSAEKLSAVHQEVQKITGVDSHVLVASSGLSMQYAIMMGLIQEAKDKYPGKDIAYIVPPNCYGGTNDQARRVAESTTGVKIMDLPVDGENDMVSSIDHVLEITASEDTIPYIIAEIPTNPRVEVPDLEELRDVLSKKRVTREGVTAIDPIFILDQTFCPNVHFLGEGKLLSTVRAIAYVSGSKFPSGGLCTAGYCVANSMTQSEMITIENHLQLCENNATSLQVEILSKQLPSMNNRIAAAYANTREFVNYIHEILPGAKINYVSEELAQEGFTPSVFSLDLPTVGETEEEREANKRTLNLKLINMMISEIPLQAKFCVSYGQLKGSYWTIPATSTQGTTKEGDKDYIVRVSISPDLDMARHKEIFRRFVDEM